ncbi:MAG: hypothetical protein GX786_10860 [Clostridiales bacterium]|nr:hypothetical protein [Clostridiales bacterium]
MSRYFPLHQLSAQHLHQSLWIKGFVRVAYTLKNTVKIFLYGSSTHFAIYLPREVAHSFNAAYGSILFPKWMHLHVYGTVRLKGKHLVIEGISYFFSQPEKNIVSFSPADSMTHTPVFTSEHISKLAETAYLSFPTEELSALAAKMTTMMHFLSCLEKAPVFSSSFSFPHTTCREDIPTSFPEPKKLLSASAHHTDEYVAVPSSLPKEEGFFG